MSSIFITPKKQQNHSLHDRLININDAKSKKNKAIISHKPLIEKKDVSYANGKSYTISINDEKELKNNFSEHRIPAVDQKNVDVKVPSTAGKAADTSKADKAADTSKVDKVADVSKADKAADVSKVDKVADVSKTDKVADASQNSHKENFFLQVFSIFSKK